MASSSRHRSSWIPLAALATSLAAGGCPGAGYVISGGPTREESPPILDAGAPEVTGARASPPPGLHVDVLCAPGPIVRSGLARRGMAAHPTGEKGLFLFAADPLSKSRDGFEVPVRAPAADVLPLTAGDWIELRAVGRAPYFGDHWPNRLQVCRWRPDRSLVGTLWRPGDSAADVAYEFRPPIAAIGLRGVGKVAVHSQDTATGWWRLRFVTQRGRIIRLRYAPVDGRALPVRAGQTLVLQVLPADPAASLRGLAVIFQEPEGGLIAALNTGGSLASEFLDGVEVTPSGRLIYSDMRQLPSLCLARIEHQSLRVRSGEGVQYVVPGTRTHFVHRGKRYRFIGYDAALRTLQDPCGEETEQRLSYVITVESEDEARRR